MSECVKHKEVFSFYKYGKIRGNNYCQKMKRLFNAGKKYSGQKEELFRVALLVDSHKSFLENFE